MGKANQLLEEAEAVIYVPGDSLPEDEDKLTWLANGANMFIGLLYIAARYPNICLPLNPKIPRNDTELSVGITSYCDWNDNSRVLNFPAGFDEKFKACQNGNKRISAFLLLTYDPYSCEGRAINAPGHANILIYDKKNNTLTRVEPHRESTFNSFNLEQIDQNMKEYFKENFNVNYEVAYPESGIRPQHLEIDDESGISASKHCAAWSLWILALKAANPDENIKDLILLSISKIERKKTLHQFIKNYAAFIVRFHINVIRKLNERLPNAYISEEAAKTAYILAIYMNAKETEIYNEIIQEELKAVASRPR